MNRSMLLGLAVILSPQALASDSAGDALAGHRAEQRQWQANQDHQRRPLFLDPVDFESGVVGLDCSHRPKASSGEGYVVLLETLETTPRRIRYFAPPGAVASLAAARVKATRFAREKVPGVELHQVAARAFLWCR